VWVFIPPHDCPFFHTTEYPAAPSSRGQSAREHCESSADDECDEDSGSDFDSRAARTTRTVGKTMRARTARTTRTTDSGRDGEGDEDSGENEDGEDSENYEDDGQW